MNDSNGKDNEESCHGLGYYPTIFQRTKNNHKIFTTATVKAKIWIRHLPNAIPLHQITWYCNTWEQFLTGVILKWNWVGGSNIPLNYTCALYCIQKIKHCMRHMCFILHTEDKALYETIQYVHAKTKWTPEYEGLGTWKVFLRKAEELTGITNAY